MDNGVPYLVFVSHFCLFQRVVQPDGDRYEKFLFLRHLQEVFGQLWTIKFHVLTMTRLD